MNKAELDFIKKHNEIHLIGDRGTGKTVLARYLESKFDCNVWELSQTTIAIRGLDDFTKDKTKPNIITNVFFYNFENLLNQPNAIIIFTSIMNNLMAAFLAKNIPKTMAKTFQRRFERSIKHKRKTRPCLVVPKTGKPFIATYSFTKFKIKPRADVDDFKKLLDDAK